MDSSMVFLIVFGIIILAVVLIYNGIISRANAAQRAWANVITQERQKNKIIPHLQAVTEQYQRTKIGVFFCSGWRTDILYANFFCAPIC